MLSLQDIVPTLARLGPLLSVLHGLWKGHQDATSESSWWFYCLRNDRIVTFRCFATRRKSWNRFAHQPATFEPWRSTFPFGPASANLSARRIALACAVWCVRSLESLGRRTCLPRNFRQSGQLLMGPSPTCLGVAKSVGRFDGSHGQDETESVAIGQSHRSARRSFDGAARPKHCCQKHWQTSGEFRFQHD